MQMPAITDKSTAEPILKTLRLGHGTLECVDIVKTRRFYEEVLGLDILQTSPRSLMIRKDTVHVYAVVETGNDTEMPMINHNGLDVGSPEAVDEAYEHLVRIKDEYGIKKIQKPRHAHGDHAFYFLDQDSNWWEIVAVRDGGYAQDYVDADVDRDLTGHHQFDGLDGNVHRIHTHDPDFRAKFRESKSETAD
jgi:catechol 2,3-dioxygenase-like lactoylglutathione lyase family enzyme